MARQVEYHSINSGVRLLVAQLLLLVAGRASLFGQASPPNYNPFPWYDPVTHTPPNSGAPSASPPGPSSWSSTTGNSPGNTWNPSMGNIPSPYTRPTREQTEWYVNNHPDLKNLDPVTKTNIVNGATLGFLAGPYLPNGRPNPFVSQTTLSPAPNWFVPSTWSSPNMNWQGV